MPCYTEIFRDRDRDGVGNRGRLGAIGMVGTEHPTEAKGLRISSRGVVIKDLRGGYGRGPATRGSAPASHAH